MEQEKQLYLQMLDRPAFCVQNGVISFVNQLARNRMISVDTPIQKLLPDDYEAYLEFTGGCLYLTLQLNCIPCGASVLRQKDWDIFLLDRDFDHAQLQVLALAAQQLRTPLSSVMTLADQILPTLPAEQAQQAAQLNRSLFQMLHAITNMSDADRYVHMETAHPEITEMDSFFRDIFEKAGAAASAAGITVCYNGLGKTLFSQTDREKVERAVLNLLSNAIKFSPEGGTVTGTLIVTGKFLRLSIEDQGQGPAFHTQGSLFSRYQREPGIEDSRFGLGLGMTLVRAAAAIHGGTVLLDHAQGTRVTMTLAIRKNQDSWVRSPALRIGDYAGGRDTALLEFSESLPVSAYTELN